MVSLKYLKNILRTLEIHLINCEIKLILTWSKKCVISSNTAENQARIFAITDKKLYVPIFTLSIDDNAQNYYSNWIQVSTEQLTGINVNQK